MRVRAENYKSENNLCWKRGKTYPECIPGLEKGIVMNKGKDCSWVRPWATFCVSFKWSCCKSFFPLHHHKDKNDLLGNKYHANNVCYHILHHAYLFLQFLLLYMQLATFICKTWCTPTMAHFKIFTEVDNNKNYLSSKEGNRIWHDQLGLNQNIISNTINESTHLGSVWQRD